MANAPLKPWVPWRHPSRKKNSTPSSRRERPIRPPFERSAAERSRKGRFQQLNYIRNLPAQQVMENEPEGLLAEATAPNASEALLAAFGSCLAVGIHANAVAQGLPIQSLELELEADINATSVWGAGDLQPKRSVSRPFESRSGSKPTSRARGWRRLFDTPRYGRRSPTRSTIRCIWMSPSRPVRGSNPWQKHSNRHEARDATTTGARWVPWCRSGVPPSTCALRTRRYRRSRWRGQDRAGDSLLHARVQKLKGILAFAGIEELAREGHELLTDM